MKKIISIILIISLIIGFANISVVPTFADTVSSSPQLNLVKGDNCFNVVWNKVDNARRYRLYFGANGNWRRYALLRPSDCTTYPKNLKSFQFLINHKSLTGHNWYLYGKDQHISTSNITSSNLFMCQIEALNGKNETIAWSNVDYIFFSSVNLSASKTKNGYIKLDWKVANNANKYQIAYRYNSKAPYSYVLLNNTTTWTITTIFNELFLYEAQIRPCYAKNNSIIGYGSWSNVAKVNKGYISSDSHKAGLLTASSVGINNLPISLGDDQYTVNNYPVGMYYRASLCFNGISIILFGHNYKTFGKIKNLSVGNYVTVQGGGNTLTYKVYNKSIYRDIDEYSMKNIYSGNVYYPYKDNSQDLVMITCHESMSNCRWVVKGKLQSIS